MCDLELFMCVGFFSIIKAIQFSEKFINIFVLYYKIAFYDLGFIYFCFIKLELTSYKNLKAGMFFSY